MMKLSKKVLHDDYYAVPPFKDGRLVDVIHLARDIEELERELAVTKSFHDVAVKERDFERNACDQLRAELDAAKAMLESVKLDLFPDEMTPEQKED